MVCWCCTCLHTSLLLQCTVGCWPLTPVLRFVGVCHVYQKWRVYAMRLCKICSTEWSLHVMWLHSTVTCKLCTTGESLYNNNVCNAVVFHNNIESLYVMRLHSTVDWKPSCNVATFHTNIENLHVMRLHSTITCKLCTTEESLYNNNVLYNSVVFHNNIESLYVMRLHSTVTLKAFMQCGYIPQ